MWRLNVVEKEKNNIEIPLKFPELVFNRTIKMQYKQFVMIYYLDNVTKCFKLEKFISTQTECFNFNFA